MRPSAGSSNSPRSQDPPLQGHSGEHVGSAELLLLYRVSATMLTTTSIDRLIHVILTALTSQSPRFFDRAALFLVNERSGFLQGMLGVTRDTSHPLVDDFRSDTHLPPGLWEIPDDLIARQCSSEFTHLIRGIRLEIDPRKNVSSRVVLDRRLIYVRDANRAQGVDREIVRKLGASSFAIAPLMARERVFGIICVDNALSSRKIDRRDLDYLQLFANHAGMAAENAFLYQRLAEANRNLAETQESLIHHERLATMGEMSATLAHEIKTPIVTISGFARRLCSRLVEGTSERAMAEMIRSEAERMERLAADILAFGRKGVLCYDTVVLSELIDSVVDGIVRLGREKGVRIERDFPAEPIVLIADPPQLRQVFLNLFLNSLDAMGRRGGGGVLEISSRPTPMHGERAVEITVADTGGGVPEQVLHRLFEPFYTTKEGGTGLGLPIVRRIVEAHGGTIRLQNGAQGLVVTVVLPLHV